MPQQVSLGHRAPLGEGYISYWATRLGKDLNLGSPAPREIELMQTKFLKHVLFVHRNTSNYITYGELGVYPIDIKIKCRVIGFLVTVD